MGIPTRLPYLRLLLGIPTGGRGPMITHIPTTLRIPTCLETICDCLGFSAFCICVFCICAFATTQLGAQHQNTTCAFLSNHLCFTTCHEDDETNQNKLQRIQGVSTDGVNFDAWDSCTTLGFSCWASHDSDDDFFKCCAGWWSACHASTHTLFPYLPKHQREQHCMAQETSSRCAFCRHQQIDSGILLSKILSPYSHQITWHWQIPFLSHWLYPIPFFKTKIKSTQ